MKEKKTTIKPSNYNLLRNDWPELTRRAKVYFDSLNFLKDLQGIPVCTSQEVMSALNETSAHDKSKCPFYKMTSTEKVFDLISRDRTLVADPCFIELYSNAQIYGDFKFISKFQKFAGFKLKRKKEGRPKDETEFNELRWFVIEFLRRKKRISKKCLDECFDDLSSLISQEPKLFIRPKGSDNSTDASSRRSVDYLRDRKEFKIIAISWYKQWKKHHRDYLIFLSKQPKNIKTTSSILTSIVMIDENLNL